MEAHCARTAENSSWESTPELSSSARAEAARSVTCEYSVAAIWLLPSTADSAKRAMRAPPPPRAEQHMEDREELGAELLLCDSAEPD